MPTILIELTKQDAYSRLLNIKWQNLLVLVNEFNLVSRESSGPPRERKKNFKMKSMSADRGTRMFIVFVFDCHEAFNDGTQADDLTVHSPVAAIFSQFFHSPVAFCLGRQNNGTIF